MTTRSKKLSAGVLFFALFLLFVAVFSIFRLRIAEYAAWLLAMTHEVSLSESKSGDGHQAIKIVSDIQYAGKGKKASGSRRVASKKKSASEMFKNPVTAKLPKTKTPIVLYTDDYPEWNDSKFPLFTPLRKFDGTIWRKEKTQIKMTTDGRRLYVVCRFFDKNPGAAITKYTEKFGGKNAWQDDSIELFLMKDKNSKFYCQYIVSVSGKGTVLYHKVTEAPNRGSNAKLPKTFVSPNYNVDEFNGGFEIEMKISLSNLGFKKLEPGDTFLLQIVRNYRGQNEKDSATLHLFPVYIYADNRLGRNNHDRRAFQKVQIERAE
jgi:hypothetical protein